MCTSWRSEHDDTESQKAENKEKWQRQRGSWQKSGESRTSEKQHEKVSAKVCLHMPLPHDQSPRGSGAQPL